MSSINFFITNYSLGLGEGAYPIYRGNKWDIIIEKDLQPRHIFMFEETAKKVVDMAKLEPINQGIEKAVVRINIAWTHLRLKSKVIGPAEEEDIIRFNSMNKVNSWLSNFFPTLVLDLDRGAIYITLEHGYVLFKGVRMGLSVEDLNKLINTDSPKEVKQRGHEICNQYQEQERAFLVEMGRLIHLKFSYNPVLQKLLKRTEGRELREFTGDPFWGTAFDEALGENSNHVGKIIMSERSNY